MKTTEKKTRDNDITPALVVDALTEWAQARLSDAKETTLIAGISYNARCALALANAAEIVKAVFPDDF